MEVIKTYLDNVFAGFAQTEQVRTLKTEMLGSMEEKYHALIDEGKSEHEAAYSVIADFGSIDEIVAELGLEAKQAETKETTDDSLFLTREQAKAYISQTKKSGFFIGLGVWIILCGVAAFLLSNLLPLFIAIALAMPLLIVNGLKIEQYDIYEKKVIRLDAATQMEMKQRRAKFIKRFAIQISCYVALILLAVGLFLWGNIPFGLELMLVMIGFAIFLIVPIGMQFSVYDILLNVGDYANKDQSSKYARIIGTFAAIYWPIVAAGYLLWSFLADAWHISWIVWPVSGAIFGAIAGGLATWGYLSE